MAETRRSGINPQAYLGVEPSSPPQFMYFRKDPTTRDYFNERIGTLWFNQAANRLWMLASLANHVATWILLNAAVVPSVVQFTMDDTGIIYPNAMGNVNAFGQVGLINTDSLTPNTIRININSQLDGLFLTGNGILNQPIWRPLISGDASITINPTALGIDIRAVGGGAGVNQINVDLGGSINPIAGIVNINGVHNITVLATAPNTAQVGTTNAITLGDLAVLAPNAGAVTCQTGDVIITAGDLTLPNTNGAGNRGIIKFGGNRFVSNFGDGNTFVGENSGNTTLDTITSTDNTGIGWHALQSLTLGGGNTALGSRCLETMNIGAANTGLGFESMRSAAGAGCNNNTALGWRALWSLTQAENNCASGYQALTSCTTGRENTAYGTNTLGAILTGQWNMGLGTNSGFNYIAAESNNVVIHNLGVTGDNNVLRIGNAIVSALMPLTTRTWIAGIRGVATGIANAIPVLIDSSGQLGTASSSIRYKENVKDIPDKAANIFDLRPIQFNYKSDESKTQRYGLIAEEVAEIMPELVIYDEEGRCETVKYDELIPLLLNELKKLKIRIDKLDKN